MQPLNYTRSLAQALANGEPVIACEKADEPALIAFWQDACKESAKFMLSADGMEFDDPELRGLDETQRLRLPFSRVAIESPQSDGKKSIIFLWEAEEMIQARVANYLPHHGWIIHDARFAIAATEYLDRSIKSKQGSPGILWTFDDEVIDPDEVWPVPRMALAFMSALACSNVKINTIQARQKLTKRSRDAIPFDDYHVLCLCTGNGKPRGSHQDGRSPREHVRRGHIRRLADGRRIWVNATVVAAGRGAGVVRKDYALT